MMAESEEEEGLTSWTEKDEKKGDRRSVVTFSVVPRDSSWNSDSPSSSRRLPRDQCWGGRSGASIMQDRGEEVSLELEGVSLRTSEGRGERFTF